MILVFGAGSGITPPPATGISLPLLFSSSVVAPPPPPPPPPVAIDETISYVQIFGGAVGTSVGISAANPTWGHLEDQPLFSSSAASPGPAPDVFSALGGGVKITTALYRADRDNVWLEDISDQVDSGSITVDLSQATPMTFQGETIVPDVLTAYRDWVAPVMTYSYPDPLTGQTITDRQQLGLFMVTPAVKTYTAAQGMESIDGRDTLWLLASSGPGEPWSRATGQNVGIAIETICGLVGVRHAIQTTSATLPKRRTWPWNATWLQIANELARSIGFVPLWTDRTGRVRTHRFRKLGNIEPARLISSSNGAVLETITLTPDLTKLCNHVVVVGNDPKGNPVVRELLNNDPDSPTSTVSLSKDPTKPVVISHYEEDPNFDTQDAVDQRADQMMEQGSSVYQRMNVKTMPVLDFEIGDTSQLDIQTDTGLEVASGKWRWDRLTMGLGLDASCDWSMLKLTSWAQVA